MKNVYVRWLGAFRARFVPMLKAIKYELNDSSMKACEQVDMGTGPNVRTWTKVGLLISKDAVFKKFGQDVWSEYKDTPEGPRLYISHHGVCSYAGHTYDLHKKSRKRMRRGNDHTECWHRGGAAAIQGIVITRRLEQLDPHVRQDVLKAHGDTGLPIYKLAKKASGSWELQPLRVGF